jgi:hypothetical protein
MPQLNVKGCSHPVFRTDRLRFVSVVRLSPLAYMHMHDIMRFRRSCLQGNYTALIVLQTAGMTEPCSLTQVPACCNLGLNMRCTAHCPPTLVYSSLLYRNDSRDDSSRCYTAAWKRSDASKFRSLFGFKNQQARASIGTVQFVPKITQIYRLGKRTSCSDRTQRSHRNRVSSYIRRSPAHRLEIWTLALPDTPYPM